MRYIEPKAATLYLLQTGDRSVLAKVDPARRNELAHWLQEAKKGLAQKTSAQRQYQELVKRAEEAERRKSQQNPLLKGVEPWEPGTAYNDFRKSKFTYRALSKEGSADAKGESLANALAKLENNGPKQYKW